MDAVIKMKWHYVANVGYNELTTRSIASLARGRLVTHLETFIANFGPARLTATAGGET